jgi:replicative DNA helicase
MIPENTFDLQKEKALLSTIFKYGKDALIDTETYVVPGDMSDRTNQKLFQSVKYISDQHNEVEKFDAEDILHAGLRIGVFQQHDISDVKKYIKSLGGDSLDMKSLPMVCESLKKYSVARELYSRYNNNIKFIKTISDETSLSDLIKTCESEILDYLNAVETGNPIEKISHGLIERINELLNNPPVRQVGYPSGYPLWDKALGGGPRPASVHVVASRSKVGKSFFSENLAINFATNNIPTLLLDTEMTKEYQQDRITCIMAECPITLFETGQMQSNKYLCNSVKDAASRLDNLPLYYQSACGLSIVEVMSFIKRWLVKKVGFNEKGKAQPCCIIYDYLKLTSGMGLSKETPEFILLGLMMTELHHFSVKYNVPIIVFSQTNRDGIDAEDTSVVAGSDRILWLCSSLTLYKNKNDIDTEMGCPIEYGNKKLIVLDTRQGPGLPTPADYINLKAMIRPGVDEEKATGKITEGLLYSQIPRKTNDDRESEGSVREDTKGGGN